VIVDPLLVEPLQRVGEHTVQQHREVQVVAVSPFATGL
jgi:hypothetical protein